MLLSRAALLLILATPACAGQVGIASTFDDRHVACPPYRINPYRTVGVAHKTLPCGTIVEVINKWNGRKVFAPVVDKGPCTTTYCIKAMPKRIRLRILDMLPMTAKAIGSNGLTLVEVR